MHSHGSVLKTSLMAALDRVTDHLKTIIVLCLVLEVVLNCFSTITCFDFPWQLAEGQFILSHGYPAHSVFEAYGEISPHFANEYILYEVIIAGINDAAGWLGLCLFFGLLAFLIHGPCLQAFLKSRRHLSLIVVFLFLLAQFLISDRLAARPELIGDICYLAVGMCLLLFDQRGWNVPRLLGLGFIFCLWSNAHGSFLIGLAMVALWYGQMLLFNWKTMFFARDFKWAMPGIAAIIGCSINPYFIDRFVQPFRVHGLLWGQGESLEMWPMTLDWARLSLAYTAAGLIVLITRIREQKSYWLMALALAVQYLSFISNRYTVFIGLTLLLILWNEARRGASHSDTPLLLPLFRSLSRAAFHFLSAIALLFFVICLLAARVFYPDRPNQFFYPNSLVSTNSSFAWLRQQPKPNFALLSLFNAGSWAQMPGWKGIHPLFDSGLHRYSDRVNELFYYIFFDPKTLSLVASDLNANAIIIDNYTMAWAAVLNASPDWKLVYIGDDSQLYLRDRNPDSTVQRQLFAQWESGNPRQHRPNQDSCSIIRGLHLRSDEESLQMLTSTPDTAWTSDPQINFYQLWLKQVPDDLIENALKSLTDRTDNSSAGLRILFLLRLNDNKSAVEIAKQWKPSILDRRYQEFQMLRAQAFLYGGDTDAACHILESLWPKPRFSLHWANLCQQAYVNDKQAEPQNARLITGLQDQPDWKKDIIDLLNQNIAHLSSQSP